MVCGVDGVESGVICYSKEEDHKINTEHQDDWQQCYIKEKGLYLGCPTMLCHATLAGGAETCSIITDRLYWLQELTLLHTFHSSFSFIGIHKHI